MVASASIGVPTVSGVQNSLMSYGVGIMAGVGHKLISGFTGSGLIGGAVAAAVVGATVRGTLGEMIAVNLGFNVGLQGLEQFGLGRLLPGASNGPASNRPRLELL